MNESREKQLEAMDRHFETVVCYLGVKYAWGAKAWSNYMKHARDYENLEDEKK